jgi:hypothetical protein
MASSEVKTGAGEPQRDVQRVARIGEALDQADLGRPLGGDRLAGEGQLHGDHAGEPAGQLPEGPRRSAAS